MKTARPATIAALLISSLGFSPGSREGAPVAGYIRDRVLVISKSDRPGLGGITVSLQDEQGNALLPDSITNVDGYFRFEGVRAGKFVVRALAPGYCEEESVREGVVAQTPLEVDPVLLVKVTDDVAYLDLFAEGTFTDSQGAVGEKAYASSWAVFESPVFPVSAKIAFAQALSRRDPQAARTLKDVTHYAAADYTSAQAAEKAIKGAMLSTAKVPARKELRVNDEILGEIVARKLADKTVSPINKTKFQGELPESWNKDLRAKIDNHIQRMPYKAPLERHETPKSTKPVEDKK